VAEERKRWRDVGWIGSAYLGEGLPWSFLHQLMTEYLQSIHASPEHVGYTSWFHLPVTAKPLWSPAVDLFGTRRVGPDLVRESGKKSNDWHVAHLYDPRSVVPYSVMPGYPWMFDENRRPTDRALAVVTYLQWLGSWVKDGVITDPGAPAAPPATAALAPGSGGEG
jgi:hypothetical protein